MIDFIEKVCEWGWRCDPDLFFNLFGIGIVVVMILVLIFRAIKD